MKKLVVPAALLFLFAFSFSLVHAQVLSPSTVPWQKTQILAPTASDQAVSEPSVLYEDGLWRMWYRVGWSNLQGIYYATSSDGIHWTKYGHVTNDYNAHVYRYNATTLVMAAHGLIDQYSQDGIHWSNFTQQYGLWPNPWLNQADPYPNEYGTIGNSQLLKLPNGTYLMYYESRNCNFQNKNPSGQSCGLIDNLWSMNEASSPDGIHDWIRASSNPILGGWNGSEGTAAANPNVVFQNGVYYAFVNYYIANTYFVETLATSPNGIKFNFIFGPTNPVLSIDVEKKLDPYCNQVGDAWVMVQPNGIYLFYDEDANVAANLTSTHASIWSAFLPNTTLTQLVTQQFGTNTFQGTDPEVSSTTIVTTSTIDSLSASVHKLRSHCVSEDL